MRSLIDNYMNNYLSTYQKNRDQNWKQMASFLNLFITANISQYTYRSGASEINLSDEQLFQYIQMYLFPDLQEENVNNLPILKATCIKFVYMFRNQIPEDLETIQNFIKLFCNYLGSESWVNQSYAAAIIEKLIIKKSRVTNQTILTNENMNQEVLMGLLTNLCNLLNERCDLYAIRCLFRVVQLSKTKVQGYSEQLGQVLTKFI